jgi:predicted O-methyltransferase YrrM
LPSADDLPPVVRDAVRRAAALGFPHSCEPAVGALLAVLAASVPAGGRILELGTGAGVGTAWLAHGLTGRADATINSVERDGRLAELAAAVPWPVVVEVHTGDAETLLPVLGVFDLVFADAEGGKWTGLDLTIAALRPGGVLLVDDMDLARYPDERHAAAVFRVRESLLTDPRLVAAELPAATGLIVATRRAQ